MTDIAEKARKVRAATSNAAMLDVCDWVLEQCKITKVSPAVILPCPVCEARRKANAAYVKKHRGKKSA